MDRLLQYYIIMNMKVKWQNDRKMETDSGVGWSLMMTLMATASGEFWRLLMTLTNNLDPDEAPQNVGPHLESKLFDIQDETAKIRQEKNIFWHFSTAKKIIRK